MDNSRLDKIRRRTEQCEEEQLSPLAAKSGRSRGRRVPEPDSQVRTAFARDRDRILHSKAFRRLKYKTQVFFSPSGDHYRTRLTHTLEVAQIARTIARALRLNEDLTEAVALGHDVGHAPFGHAGEQALDLLCPGGFVHSQQSLRVLDALEKDGQGLNLTWEVRDGIAYHSKHQESVAQPLLDASGTVEGAVVRMCDAVAYLNADIDDALRAGLMSVEELPEESRQVLGVSHSERIEAMVHGIICESYDIATGEIGDGVRMSPDVLAATDALRDYMFREVYKHPDVEREATKARMVVTQLYEYFEENPDELRARVESGEQGWNVCDYVSGMTDRYATSLFLELFTPQPWAY